MVPVFGPALHKNIDYVIEYVMKVKNNKGRNIAMFTDMYEVIANPTSLSDEEIWIIILDIIRKFDLFFANTYNNPLWEIFRQGDTTVKKLTGFMLQHYQSSLATKMLGLCRLQPVDYVPTASAVLLAWMLSCI